MTLCSTLSRNDQQSVLTPTWSTPTISSFNWDSETTEGTNKAVDMNFRDVVLSRTSMNHPLAETETELESHTDRLLRLTRDLYEVTHLPDAAVPFSEMRQEEHTPVNRLLDKQETQQTPKKQQEQVLFPKVQGNTLPGPAVWPHELDVCTVLRSLLDLVDEHWNGQFSLHLNPNFMAKAILILLSLTKPVLPSKTEDKHIRGSIDELKVMRESGACWDVEKSRQVKSRLVNELIGNKEWKSCEEYRSDVSEVRHLKRQLAKTQHAQESLKTRLISALKENFILRAEKRKIITGLESDTTLLELGVHLESDTQVLQKQDKLLKQLERTLHLLKDNQRSLVSHNDLRRNVIKRTSKCSKT
ncbi:uncharacterized protein Hap1MRO34_004227 [Clarias gariepinus]